MVRAQFREEVCGQSKRCVISEKFQTRNMPVIAIASEKGGVGKTTTCINLGAALAQTGKKVLLVDLDSQKSLSLALGLDDQPSKTVFDLLTGNGTLDEVILKSAAFDLIPSSKSLSGIGRAMATVLEPFNALNDELSKISGRYDFILIDCSPSLGLTTLNALVAADQVIIPLMPSYLALKGVESVQNTIEQVSQRLNPKLRVLGILISQADTRKILHRDLLKTLEASHGALLFETRIRVNIALSESQAMKQDILAYAPTSPGAEDYQALAQEMLDRL